MDDPKKKFLLYIFFSNSVQGASQHNKIYIKKEEDMSPDEKKMKAEMKGYLLTELKNLPSSLGTDIAGCVRTLQNSITKDYKKILWDGQITFGTVQKLVNLYLKYLWVAGFLGEKDPPHCPVDRKVLEAVGWGGNPWTKMKEKDYREAIRHISQKAGGDEFIAKWELENWPFSR